MSQTLYRRPLPEDLVAFASPEGRTLFREALEDGTLEGWFSLAEQFHTQADPAFCGLGSLVVALNALGVDPQRLWKGPWRWFSEELLDCCVSLDVVRARGITLTELGCLARCNGVTTNVSFASNLKVDAVEATIEAAARGSGAVVIAAYSRRVLGQTGDGHYSPVGGYNARRRLALVLDVARFKYPPHWVSIDLLYEGMLAIDPDTKRSRGLIELRQKEKPAGLLASIACGQKPWADVASVFDRTARRWRERAPTSIDDALSVVDDEARGVSEHLTWRSPVDASHAALLSRFREALRQSAAGRAFSRLTRLTREAAPTEGALELTTALFYTLGPEDFAALPSELRDSVTRLADVAAIRDPELGSELARLRDQLASLRAQRDGDASRAHAP